MSANVKLESADLAEGRWEELRLVQEHYKDFLDFLLDVMELLGFSTTDIQEDIGGYMVYGPQQIMVQAQRSQAKTTIAAAYAVWCLIHSPTHRVLIVSAGGTQANEISTLIIRIIMHMDVLECMRPDRQAGDRASTEAFDLHHSLKGVEKSPSVACVGITANLQGKRADLLIADDVESAKNSLTQHMRALLSDLTKDFVSICVGRIIWLGTPQTGDSIYNALPARGVAVRIWPGRYPTPEQMKNYGDYLAPLLQRRIAADPSLQTGGGVLGNQGKPIDPVLLGEDKLQQKELNQGEAYFQLQHMLNTQLTDAARFPLKPEKLVVLSAGEKLAPSMVTRSVTNAVRELVIGDFPFKLALPHSVSPELLKYEKVWATVDPAAGGLNGDETAYAVGGFLNGNVYLFAVGAVKGGYDDDKMAALADKLLRWPIQGITIEKNMGYGAFTHVFATKLAAKCVELGIPQPALEDELVSGMKEARIIETLEPVMGRGSLIVCESAIEEDKDCCRGYAAAQQKFYSFFYQLAKMQKVRGACIHDDRADAVEALVRKFQKLLQADQAKATEKQREAAMKEALHKAMPKLYQKVNSTATPITSYFRK